MKALTATAIAAAALASAKSAQTYSTSTYTECTDLPDATLTSYDTKTVTYCSECEGGMTTMTGEYIRTTVWTTTMLDFCPTGLTEAPVTITESCTNATPTWSPGQPNYVPQGYTTSLMTCSVCGESPITRIMTYPVGSPPTYPSAGPAVTAEGPNIVGSPCPGPECRVPYPTAAPAPVPASQGAPTPPAAPPGCTGANCPAPEVSPNAIPAPSGNTSNIMPYPSAAPIVSAFLPCLIALLIGTAVAFFAV